jgi:nucleotide-binding universal stress UspA family protein
MPTLLFPTDFSAAAAHAFGFALALAEQMRARIVLFHAYHYSLVDTDVIPAELLEALEAEEHDFALAQFQRYEAELQALHGKKVPISHRLVAGFGREEILREARTLKPDLIVMGTTGAHNALEAWFGSITAGVMEEAPCPVLAIPASFPLQQIKRIAYATDLLEKDRRVFYFLSQWAHMLRAELHCVHVVDEAVSHREQQLLEEMHDTSLPFASPPLHVLSAKAVWQGLKSFIETQQVDLLAAMPHRRSLWDSLFHRSLTRQLFHEAGLPVLAIPDRM